jgi:hypothetical protein
MIFSARVCGNGSHEPGVEHLGAPAVAFARHLLACLLPTMTEQTSKRCRCRLHTPRRLTENPKSSARERTLTANRSLRALLFATAWLLHTLSLFDVTDTLTEELLVLPTIAEDDAGPPERRLSLAPPAANDGIGPRVPPRDLGRHVHPHCSSQPREAASLMHELTQTLTALRAPVQHRRHNDIGAQHELVCHGVRLRVVAKVQQHWSHNWPTKARRLARHRSENGKLHSDSCNNLLKEFTAVGCKKGKEPDAALEVPQQLLRGPRLP